MRDRRAHCDDVRGRADVHRDRGGPDARGDRGDRCTDAPDAARDVPRYWRAGWPGGQRRGRSDLRCPNEDAQRPDQRRRAAPRVPSAARSAARNGVLRAVRLAVHLAVHFAAPVAMARAGPRRPMMAPTEPRGRRSAPPQWRRRALRDEGAARGGVGGPPRARQPPLAAVRHPSARAPTVHRDTDCRRHRNRGTARHWCGCGEWGVCVRSFENCEWYSGLRSDLEGSATPPQA